VKATRILFWSLALAGWLVAAALITLRWHPQAPAAAEAPRVLCPVCHAVVDPATASHAAYRGVTYYFCQATEGGRSHKELFLAWPDHYLSGQPMLPVADRAPSPAPAAPAPSAALLPTATPAALAAHLAPRPDPPATAQPPSPSPVAARSPQPLAGEGLPPQSLPTMPPARQSLGEP
jgi:YHS domain-containing protein